MVSQETQLGGSFTQVFRGTPKDFCDLAVHLHTPTNAVVLVSHTQYSLGTVVAGVTLKLIFFLISRVGHIGTVAAVCIAAVHKCSEVIGAEVERKRLIVWFADGGRHT